MSIEVLDKKSPVRRREGGMNVDVYAFERHEDRSFVLGDEKTNRRPFAYITQQTEFRACGYGAPKQKVSIISGVVRSDPPQSFRKEVRERAFDGLLILPFPKLRHKLAMKRTAGDIIDTKAIQDALNSQPEETQLAGQKLATS